MISDSQLIAVKDCDSPAEVGLCLESTRPDSEPEKCDEI